MSRLPRLTVGASLLVALCLVASAGCGQKYGKVSGEVKFKGKPIEHGTIGFQPQERGARAAIGVIENGRYSMDVPVGEYAITVTVIVRTLTEKEKKDLAKKKRDKKKKYEDDKFPAKYTDSKTSNQKLTVVAGEQTHNLDFQPDS